MCECVYVCETRIETEERQRGIQKEGGREGGGEERRGGRKRETFESCCLLPCGSRVELRSLNLTAGTFTHGTISGPFF